MAGLINELMDVLTDLAGCVTALTELALAKKDVIIKNDVDNLKKITSHENIIVGKCQKLERTRTAITKDIALVLNEKEENLSLSRLGELIKGQKEFESFINVSNTLVDKLDALKTANDLNRTLIENALDYIEFSVNVMRGTFGDTDSFMEDRRGLGEGRGFLDSKN